MPYPITVGYSKVRNPDMPLPGYETPGAAALDLSAAETQVVASGACDLIPTGFIVRVPAGFVGLVLPRSSLFRKTGLIMPHSMGVIDSDYCGPEDEVFLQLQNTTSEPVTVIAGTRLAQLLVLEAPQVSWLPFNPGETSRGGFGSTGV